MRGFHDYFCYFYILLDSIKFETSKFYFDNKAKEVELFIADWKDQ